MEAFKNTSMMIILAGIFYGAYQMFVSEPPNWRKDASAAPELLMSASDPTLQPSAGGVLPGSLANGPTVPASTPSGFAPSFGGENQVGFAATQPGAPAPSLSPQFSAPQAPSQPAPSQSAPSQPFATQPLPTQPLATQSLPTQPLPTQPLPTQPSVSPLGQPSSPSVAGWAGGGESAVVPAGFAAPAGSVTSASALPATASQPGEPFASDRQRLGGGVATGPNPTGGLEAASSLLPIQPNSAPAAEPGMELTQGLRSAMEVAGVDIQNGEWAKALRSLSAWYQQPLAAEDREQLVDWLDRLAGEVIYSNQHTLAAGHVVGAGETLASIAARYQMPPRLLARINQYPETVTEDTPLQAGVELKVVPGPFAAEARLSSGYLTMFAGGLYAGRFRFVIGDSAPEDLIEEPISFVSTQGIPAQEEQRRHEPLAATNPFGRFCLVVGQTAVLHSPGGNPNGSCLQFSEQDMQDLLILLPRGTTVRIVR